MRHTKPMACAVKRNRILKGQARLGRLALFIFLVIAAVSVPHGRVEAKAGDHGVGLGVGQVMLMGDWSDHVSDAIGFNLKYSYEASEMFGVMADIHYSSHSNALETNTLGLKGLTPNLRVNLAYIDKLVVYGFTGFGLFLVDQKRGTVSASTMTLGFDLGAAANLTLNDHFQFGTQFSFHNIFEKTARSTTAGGEVVTTPIGGTYFMLALNLIYIF